MRRIEYQQTDHYRVTRDFLMRTEQMLAVLLEAQPEPEDGRPTADG